MILSFGWFTTIKSNITRQRNTRFDNITEKVSSSGGANKLRAYLVSASDAVADSNEDKIPISNGDKISNSNVNMAMAAEIEAEGSGKWYRYWYRRGRQRHQ